MCAVGYEPNHQIAIARLNQETCATKSISLELP